MNRYEPRHLRDTLLAQAALCEHIAAAAANEDTALGFRQLADECRVEAATVYVPPVVK